MVGEQVYPLDGLREPVRLGAGLRNDKILDEGVQERAMECLMRFGERLRGFPKGAVRAVGTNTLRVAKNAKSFLKRAQGALGVPIDDVFSSLSATLGGTATFALDNPSHAGKVYVMIGTLSGTSPGFRIGTAQVPINVDSFTVLGLHLIATPIFPGFVGALDAEGCATARLVLPPLPGLANQTMHFAFVQDPARWDFASNAAALRLLP